MLELPNLNCFALYFTIYQVNQIGSVTESIEAVKMSKRAGWGVMASHRRYILFFVAFINYFFTNNISDMVPLFVAVVKPRILS